MQHPERPAGGLAVLASDHERERTVAVLQEHWAAGRLTLPEFEARTEEAWRGRRAADLWVAVRDLPVPVRAQPDWIQPVPPPRRPSGAGTAALALGIVGLALLILSIGLLSPLTLAISICAWAIGGTARRRSPGAGHAPHPTGGPAMGGEALGIVGTALSAVVLAGYGAFFVMS